MVHEHYRKQKQQGGRDVCSCFTGSIDEDSGYVGEGAALVRRVKERDILVTTCLEMMK